MQQQGSINDPRRTEKNYKTIMKYAGTLQRHHTNASRSMFNKTEKKYEEA